MHHRSWWGSPLSSSCCNYGHLPCFAVTVSFGGEVVDPSIFALFLRDGTDSYTGMCQGRLNLTYVRER